MHACMHTFIHTCHDKHLGISVWSDHFLLSGLSDGSGEDDVSPMGSSGGQRQFPDQRGQPERPVQQDMDYSSTNTLWGNSSRYHYQFIFLLLVTIYIYI